jgi:hypothetical protein
MEENTTGNKIETKRKAAAVSQRRYVKVKQEEELQHRFIYNLNIYARTKNHKTAV